jgi:hypothetical protein
LPASASASGQSCGPPRGRAAGSCCRCCALAPARPVSPPARQAGHALRVRSLGDWTQMGCWIRGRMGAVVPSSTAPICRGAWPAGVADAGTQYVTCDGMAVASGGNGRCEAWLAHHMILVEAAVSVAGNRVGANVDEWEHAAQTAEAAAARSGNGPLAHAAIINGPRANAPGCGDDQHICKPGAPTVLYGRGPTSCFTKMQATCTG